MHAKTRTSEKLSSVIRLGDIAQNVLLPTCLQITKHPQESYENKNHNLSSQSLEHADL